MSNTRPILLCVSPTIRSSALWKCLPVSCFIMALALCGCAFRTHWKKESFALTAPAVHAGSVTHTNTLSLHRVTISPLFDFQPFVYRTGENSYERDPYAEFLAPPNQVLEQSIRTYLRNGSGFADVLDPGSNLKSSCSVEVSVSELYGDFRNLEKPFAVLEMRFLLYSTEPANRGRAFWTHEYSIRLPLAYRTPAALVAGWNAGLQQIMQEVNAELRRLAIPQALPMATGIEK